MKLKFTITSGTKYTDSELKKEEIDSFSQYEFDSGQFRLDVPKEFHSIPPEKLEQLKASGKISYTIEKRTVVNIEKISN